VLYIIHYLNGYLLTTSCTVAEFSDMDGRTPSISENSDFSPPRRGGVGGGGEYKVSLNSVVIPRR
jgi:hypothetical protein